MLRAVALGVVTVLLLFVLSAVLGAGVGLMELTVFCVVGVLVAMWSFRAARPSSGQSA